MQTIPVYIYATFGFACLLAVWFFYKASGSSVKPIGIIVLWVLFQSVLSLAGFYLNTQALPPRFLLLVLPAIIFILILFSTSVGRKFIDSLNIHWLTLVHSVRIPVELVLLGLYLSKVVPRLMTFEGRNFDIIAGITAIMIYYFAFIKKTLSSKALLAWNFISLALLVNIVVSAVLSAPTPFQQFGFDQPNLALLYFPFTLLPSVLVPIVLFAHLVTIRQLVKATKNSAPSFLNYQNEK